MVAVCVALMILVGGCEFKDITLMEVNSMNVSQFDGQHMEAVVGVRISNPNGFTVTVEEGHFDLFMNEKSVGKATLKSPLHLEAGSTDVHQVAITGELTNVLGSGAAGLLGMLSGKNPALLLKGEVKAGRWFFKRTVPFELETELPLKSLF